MLTFIKKAKNRFARGQFINTFIMSTAVKFEYSIKKTEDFLVEKNNSARKVNLRYFQTTFYHLR
jgi:hypothetical protein